MDQTLVTKLNKLNRKFYSDSAESFDNSRNFYWKGWDELLSQISKVSSCLDIGCGNGRFGEFLFKHFPEIKYTGIDFSSELLASAEQKLAAHKEVKLIEADILSNWDEDLENFDLIACFGVLHHIPGLENRKLLIQKMLEHLNQDGMLAVTAWRFVFNPKFKEKIVDTDTVKSEFDIDTGEFDKNDYILDWNRGEKGYRFAHFVDEDEMKLLISGSGEIMKKYQADGQDNISNDYYILRKV